LNTRLKATVYAGTPAKTGSNASAVSRTLGVAIGSICCAVICRDDEIYRRLSGLYRDFLTELTPDITIELERTEVEGPAPGGDSPEPVFDILVGRSDLFIAEMGWDPAGSDASLRYINRLFYLAYYTACLEKYGGDPPAMLVHACGILRQGRALLFAGPSESGKTTIAGICREKDGRVISDEMVLVSRPGSDGGAASVRSVPIIGGFPPGLNITAPLSCILMLKRGERTRIRPLEPVEAYLRLISQTITPCYIGQREIKPILSLLADFSQKMVKSVPVYEMEFALDGDSLWQEIGNLEEMLYGKVVR
jgi:hypothetical protein